MEPRDKLFQEKMKNLYQSERGNLGHATFMALTESYLDTGLDKMTARTMMMLQDEVDCGQRLLYQRLESKRITAADYVIANNRLIASFAIKAESILGCERFRSIFKASAPELNRFLDMDILLGM